MLKTLFRLSSPVLLVMLSIFRADAETLKVRASRFIDGDTFGLSVRLIGVDTPETRFPGKPPEPFGKEASRFLRKLLAGTTLRLEFDQDAVDRYGRLLAYVFLPDETFLNALLVCEGYARASTHPPNIKYADLFRQLEREAREAQRGLWGILDPQPGDGQETRPDSVLAHEGNLYGSEGCRERTRR